MCTSVDRKVMGFFFNEIKQKFVVFLVEHFERNIVHFFQVVNEGIILNEIGAFREIEF